MASFDELEIHRPELAQSYLKLLAAQPGRPIALFAPRRVGKTFFLAHDLGPAAQRAKLLPVYADLWLHRRQPLEAINHALEEALDDVKVPTRSLGKLAKTPVKRIGALGASIELGDEPRRRDLPAQPALRLDVLVARLSKASGRNVLLLLDEIQTLGEAADGQSVISTLRAVLQKHRKEVAAVFTGSSQSALAVMMVSAGGPMYQFAQLMDFPVLGEEYLLLLAQHFGRVHRSKRLSMEELARAFAHIGYKPALMKDLIKLMSAEGTTNVREALGKFMRDDRQIAGWQAIVDQLGILERTVLLALARGNAPLASDTLKSIGRMVPGGVTLSKVRVALDRLKRAGIVAKSAGRFVVEDRLFADYLLSRQ